MNTIEFNGKHYPIHTSVGFAAQFAFPFAKHICKGVGYDIGCNRPEWALSGSMCIDPAIPECKYDAFNLPPFEVDYIFSSHCLEHINDWVGALDYWAEKIKPGGTIFLYLPHPEQEYWLPFNNRKHVHSLTPEILKGYFKARPQFDPTKTFVTNGFDLNYSFYAIGTKRKAE